MLSDKYKLKFRKNTDDIDDELPQYSLSYKCSPENAAGVSHEIISAFIDKNDVIIEINSDMSGPGFDAADPVAEFMGKSSAFNLHYSIRNVQSEKCRTLFGFPMNIGKKKTAKEALFLIPNDVWHRPDFRGSLPLNGAGYYIVNGSEDVSGRLVEIERMSLPDKAGIFKAVIFDLAICCQMGITSVHLSMDEIKGMLGL